MTPSSMLTAHARAMPSKEDSSPPSSPRLRLTRVLLAPALLLLGLGAVACSSSPSASSSADSLVSQGLSAESSGQTQQAVKDFTAALAKEPTNAIAYYDLGVVYQQNLNEPTQAATEYNKALLVNPKYKPAMYNLAIIDTSSDPQAAINLYNQLLALNPNDANVNFNLGLLLISQHQTTQGDADLKKAILISPALAKRVPAGITP
jgi:tetratricopeptide (TPR) repeat protein